MFEAGAGYAGVARDHGGIRACLITLVLNGTAVAVLIGVTNTPEYRSLSLGKSLFYLAIDEAVARGARPPRPARRGTNAERAVVVASPALTAGPSPRRIRRAKSHPPEPVAGDPRELARTLGEGHVDRRRRASTPRCRRGRPLRGHRSRVLEPRPRCGTPCRDRGRSSPGHRY